MLKNRDSRLLTKQVEELKNQETTELHKLHKIFCEMDRKARKLESGNDRKNVLIDKWVDQWRCRMQKKKLWDFWAEYSKGKSDLKKNEDFCEQFY